MKELKYKIEFFSCWHTSSGLSKGSDSSNSVIKNELNLPFIPGKTIKGLLRDAAEKISILSNEKTIDSAFIHNFFGIGDDEAEKAALELKGSIDGAQESNAGLCFFSDANLSKHLTEGIIRNKTTAFLYQNVTSTKIGKNGQAKDQSLRSIEVTIPLTFYGRIENHEFKGKELEKIEYCFHWVRRLGLNRNRGLGRCQFTII